METGDSNGSKTGRLQKNDCYYNMYANNYSGYMFGFKKLIAIKVLLLRMQNEYDIIYA